MIKFIHQTWLRYCQKVSIHIFCCFIVKEIMITNKVAKYDAHVPVSCCLYEIFFFSS